MLKRSQCQRGGFSLSTGICGTGKDLDGTFGLIETAVKTAGVCTKLAHLPPVSAVTDGQMNLQESSFGVTAREIYSG